LLHALCWIHAERSINKLVGFNDAQRNALDGIRSRIWEFYGELRTYKQTPATNKRAELEKRFDEIFTTRTCYSSNFSISLGQAIFKCFRLASRWGLPSGLGGPGQSS
jgi:hypothetical protein